MKIYRNGKEIVLTDEEIMEAHAEHIKSFMRNELITVYGLPIYLRRFLEDPLLPLDNNDAERSIKSFCVGKHSWHIIDSTKGAKASALLYSIAESAKANSLKPYEYFCYLLTELVKYPRNDVPTEVLKTLMPWSEELPDHCRKTKSR